MLTKGGSFYVSTIKGDYAHSGFVAASTGDKTYVYYYAEADVRDALIQNYFEVLEVNHKQLSKADGTVSEEMVFLAKKI